MTVYVVTALEGLKVETVKVFLEEKVAYAFAGSLRKNWVHGPVDVFVKVVQ